MTALVHRQPVFEWFNYSEPFAGGRYHGRAYLQPLWPLVYLTAAQLDAIGATPKSKTALEMEAQDLANSNKVALNLTKPTISTIDIGVNPIPILPAIGKGLRRTYLQLTAQLANTETILIGVDGPGELELPGGGYWAPTDAWPQGTVWAYRTNAVAGTARLTIVEAIAKDN